MSVDSKKLGYLLRHASDDELRLGPGGWAEVEAVCEAMGQLSSEALTAIVEASDRYELSEDAVLVRARHGHSRPVELDYAPATPPDELFHGTTPEALVAILAEGLVPMSRQYVHLSPSEALARQVATRHGKPVLLVVDAAGMGRQGHVFFRAVDRVWLTARVPATFLRPR